MTRPSTHGTFRSQDRAAAGSSFWDALTGFGMWCLMYIVEFVAAGLVFLALRWRFRHR